MHSPNNPKNPCNPINPNIPNTLNAPNNPIISSSAAAELLMKKEDQLFEFVRRREDEHRERVEVGQAKARSWQQKRAQLAADELQYQVNITTFVFY